MVGWCEKWGHLMTHVNGELSIAIVHEKLGIWSIIALGFKPFLGEEKHVSLIRRNGQTWCKSVVYYEQMRFCVLDHIFSMDSGFGVSEIWVIANVLWWRKNDEKPPVWCLKQPHCFLLNVNYSIVHHACLRLPLEHTCFVHTMITFLETKLSSNKKNMFIRQVYQGSTKYLVSKCNTIQLWWLKLYVHRQNRIIDSQNTHAWCFSTPNLIVKAVLIPKTRPTPIFAPKRCTKHLFLPCQVRGKFLQIVFFNQSLKIGYPKNVMVHHVSQDSVHWGIPTALPQSCVFENKLRPQVHPLQAYLLFMSPSYLYLCPKICGLLCLMSVVYCCLTSSSLDLFNHEFHGSVQSPSMFLCTKIQSITCLLYPSVGFQTTILWDIMRYHHPTLFFSKFGWYRYPKLASWILLDPRIGYLQVSPSFSMISIDLLSIYEYMDCIHDTDPPRKTDTFRQVINPSTQHSQHPARGERLENADLLHHQHHRLADVDLGCFCFWSSTASALPGTKGWNRQEEW